MAEVRAVGMRRAKRRKCMVEVGVGVVGRAEGGYGGGRDAREVGE